MTSPGSGPPAPTRFAVAPPFPNPFNDRFYVEFSLPEPAPVACRLYDMRGRRVMETEQPFAVGRHRISITAGSLPAGVYLLEVRSGAGRGLVKAAHVK